MSARPFHLALPTAKLKETEIFYAKYWVAVLGEPAMSGSI